MVIDTILNINKPSSLSSTKVVGRIKWLLGRRTKVGHAGTLDGFASGVLLLLLGRATRRSEAVMNQPKQYVAKMRLGATTLTHDRGSPENPTPGAQAPSLAALEAALATQCGEVLQHPPIISALKLGGMRACDRVRQGEIVALAPRRVQIYSIELLDYTWPDATIRVDCGRGTYIRAIARDVGDMLGVGGYLTELCRTRVGEHTIEDAIPFDSIRRETLRELVGAPFEEPTPHP